jgi:enoyl-[acyl-carrier protein] reductase III
MVPSIHRRGLKGSTHLPKAALESHTRQLALELIGKGICVNAIQAGAADTPALRAIPSHEEAVAHVKSLHPEGRLTVPDDVARVIVAMADQRVDWLTGTVIRVDGGEDNW